MGLKQVHLFGKMHDQKRFNYLNEGIILLMERTVY